MTDTNGGNAVNAAKDYFDAKAFAWDSFCRPDYEKIDAILQVAGLQSGKRILDVACGTGALFPCLLGYAPALLRAIDLSPEMVRIAKEKHRDSCLEVSAADFYSFEESGFDDLIVYNAYPHFLDKEMFVQKAFRCLKPGGRLIIAHGSGRDSINGGHAEKTVQTISTPLKTCREEAARLGDAFKFDVMVDTESVYILSGVR